MTTSQRWQPMCGDCWREVLPDQYYPEASTYDECAGCGQTALVVNVHPEVVRDLRGMTDAQIASTFVAPTNGQAVAPCIRHQVWTPYDETCKKCGQPVA